jgi:hypothetical protein
MLGLVFSFKVGMPSFTYSGIGGTLRLPINIGAIPKLNTAITIMPSPQHYSLRAKFIATKVWQLEMTANVMLCAQAAY